MNKQFSSGNSHYNAWQIIKGTTNANLLNAGYTGVHFERLAQSSRPFIVDVVRAQTAIWRENMWYMIYLLSANEWINSAQVATHTIMHDKSKKVPPMRTY